MTSMPEMITGGVDTHLDVHVAAALDGVGGLLGVEVFPADAKGYRSLLRWLQSFGEVVLVGVEGTGSYGAGLTRHLHRQGVKVVEVDRPNRQVRRRRGKSDPADAVAAARAAMSGDASVDAKTRNGSVEVIRVLRVVRHSARKDRTRAVNQMRSLVSTAPEEIREDMRDLPIRPLLERAASFRPAGRNDVLGATKTALRMLAKRALALAEEIKAIDAILDPIVEAIAPELVGRPGVGPETAGALLVAVGDNPERLRSEAGFANLCGVSPMDASSGKQQRHRLNRGGDRQANSDRRGARANACHPAQGVACQADSHGSTEANVAAALAGLADLLTGGTIENGASEADDSERGSNVAGAGDPLVRWRRISKRGRE